VGRAVQELALPGLHRARLRLLAVQVALRQRRARRSPCTPLFRSLRRARVDAPAQRLLVEGLEEGVVSAAVPLEVFLRAQELGLEALGGAALGQEGHPPPLPDALPSPAQEPLVQVADQAGAVFGAVLDLPRQGVAG